MQYEHCTEEGKIDSTRDGGICARPSRSQPFNRGVARALGRLTFQRKWGDRLKVEVSAYPLVRSIKFCGKHSDSRRSVTNRDWTDDHFANCSAMTARRGLRRGERIL